MKLNEVILENWCQYEGKHIFNFGHDSNKNVVLIHADNDVGKSSLFYSIAWCFHEKQPDKWVNNNWPLYPLPWYHRAKINDEIQTKVEIIFEHKNTKYSAIRSFKTQKTKNGAVEVDRNFVFLRENVDGNWVNDSEERLNRIFPKSVLGYFIFDAETVEHFVNQSENVQQSVKRLLDIEDAERAVDHLQKIASELQKEFKDKGQIGEKRTQYEEQISTIQKSIDGLKEELDDPKNGLKAELDLTRKQRKGVEDDLFKFKDAHALLDEEKKIENEIEGNKQETQETLKKIRSLTTGMYISMAYPIVQKNLLFLEKKRKEGELPKNIKQTFVDDRIKIGKCICGTKLIPGEKAYQEICQFRTTLSDELSDLSQVLNSGLIAIKEKGKSQRDQLLNFMKQLHSLRENFHKLKNDHTTVRSKIQLRKDIPDVPRLQSRKEYLETQEATILRRIPEIEIELKRKNEFLDDYNALLKAEIKSQSKSSTSERQWILATSAHKALNQTIAAFKSKARKYLEDQCNIIGRELFWREDIYTIHINDDYLISVTNPDYGEKNLLAGMSMGVTQMTGLALIAALARQTHAQAPLIMDTPFARLSPAHITRAISECPKHFQQWILFLQPSEWNDSEYRKILSSKIQKEFTLKRDNETGITSSTVGYHKEYFGKTRS